MYNLFMIMGKRGIGRGFTILEVVLTSVLSLIAMFLSADALISFQREQVATQKYIQRDMDYMVAQRYFFKSASEAAYFKVPDPNTIEIYGYDRSRTAIYNDTIASPGVVTNKLFPKATATFEGVTAVKGLYKTVRITLTAAGEKTNFTNSFVVKANLDIEPPTSWALIINNPAGGRLSLTKAIATKDSAGRCSGYIIGSSLSSNNGSEYLLHVVKITTGGNVSWVKTISGLYPGPIGSVNIIQDPIDRGYILSGYFNSGAAYNGYISKITEDGTSCLWLRTFGTYDMHFEGACPVVNANGEADGYAVAGSCCLWTFIGNSDGNDALLVKLDTDGNFTTGRSFAKAYGGDTGNPMHENAYYVKQAFLADNTTPDGYVVFGNTQTFSSYGSPIPMVMKVDGNGNIGDAYPRTHSEAIVFRMAGGNAGTSSFSTIRPNNTNGCTALGMIFFTGWPIHSASWFDGNGAHTSSSRFSQTDSYYLPSIITSDGNYMGLSYDMSDLSVSSIDLISTIWAGQFTPVSDYYLYYPEMIEAFKPKGTSDGCLVYFLGMDMATGNEFMYYFVKTDASGNCPEASDPARYTSTPTPLIPDAASHDDLATIANSRVNLQAPPITQQVNVDLD